MPPHPKRRLLCAAIYGLFLLLLAEGGARLFWFARGVPFFTAQRRLHLSFYPGLAALERERATPRVQSGAPDAECLEVLLLGGSALNNGYGDIEHLLRERLTREIRRCVRVHNLSEPGHTTLDSLYKYEHLADQHFDLVIVYHGINEVRANNCPRDVFRDDYGHFSWYRLINAAEDGSASRWFVLPFTIEFVAVKLADRLGWSSTLPTHRPDAVSMEYGCAVKTAGPFRANLEGIVKTAAARREPLMLMTFAYYVPVDYTEARFKARALDYTAHLLPIELWGQPACVVAILSAHNEAVRELASRYPDVLFVDQEAMIPKGGLYFNDICHFTHEGCERFVTDLLDKALPVASLPRHPD